MAPTEEADDAAEKKTTENSNVDSLVFASRVLSLPASLSLRSRLKRVLESKH